MAHETYENVSGEDLERLKLQRLDWIAEKLDLLLTSSRRVENLLQSASFAKSLER